MTEFLCKMKFSMELTRTCSWQWPQPCSLLVQGCLVQVGNGIELEAVGLQFEPYQWRPCGVTWDSSRIVVVIKLRLTSALHCNDQTSMNRAHRSVLNFKYSVHVSEVNESLDEHWANFVQREKPFQLQSMCNVINVYYVLIKVCSQEFQYISSCPVWWMRVDINLLLSSISAFATDLRRIETPDSLFWNFRAD